MDTATLLQYSTDNQHFHYYHHHHQSPYSSNNRTRNTQTGLFRSSTLPVLDKTASLINGSSGGVFLNPRIPISSSSSFTRPLYPIQPPLLPLPAMAAFTTTKSIHQSLPTLPPPPAAQKKHKGTINSKKKSTKDSQQITNPSKRSSSNTKGSNKNTTIDVTKVDSLRTRAVVQRVGGGGANNEKVAFGDDQMMGFPDDDSVFAVSPPPSSLPLPKFSLRPKVAISSSCNLEAHNRTSIGDGVHLDAAGATDNLCRILNLR